MGYEIHPYGISIGQKSSFLLQLAYKEDNRDVFLKTEDDTLAVFFDKSEIDDDRQEKINWPDSLFSLCPQDFVKALRNLNIDEPSYIDECCTLLDWWNFLEDILRTYDGFHLFPVLKQDVLNGVYAKLFGGNNLQAMMPDGHSQDNPYHPFWTHEEIQIFKQEMIRLYDYFITKCPECLAKEFMQYKM